MELKQVSLDSFIPLPKGEAQYPIEFMQVQYALKLQEGETEIKVGLCEDSPQLRQQLLNFHHRKEVEFFLVFRSEFVSFLTQLQEEAAAAGSAGGSGPGPAGSGARSGTDAGSGGGRGAGGGAGKVGGFGAGPGADRQGIDAAGSGKQTDNLTLDRIANDAPVVNLLNSLIMQAVRQEASDVHIDAFEADVSVRYRIDGVLQKVRSLEHDIFPALSSRMKLMADLNIMERRLPQDGRFSVTIGGRKIDIRLSIVPIARGESIVMRIFRTNEDPLGLEELGMGGECITHIRTLLSHPHGLILVTGPTGSGKTTTLNAMVREIRDESVKIITIENPVEYVIDGVDQIQTNEVLGLTFDALLRRVLRQDPDIIMVGEIRDGDTAALAVRAALTGHLVLSTLHTNDAASAVTRLENLGVQPFLLAATLRGVIAQRLVRTLCPQCRKKTGISAVSREIFDRFGVKASDEYLPAGCEHCSGIGYRGRTAVSEYFTVDPKIAEIISREGNEELLRRTIRENGGGSLFQSALERAARGETSIKEVERTVIL